MNKILIIQTAFIGDVILATSLIEVIKKELPNIQIDFLLRAGNQTLLETNPHIKNIFIWEKKKNKFRSLINNILEIRKEKYDAVLNIQRFFNSGIVTVLSGAKLKIGFDKNPLSLFFSHKIKHLIPHFEDANYFHEVERNFQLAQIFIKKPYKRLELRPQLYFDESDHNVIKNLNIQTPYIIMAPASVWYTKQWHINKWKELIELIPSNISIYLIGAPSDQEYLSPLIHYKNVINLCTKLSLRQSALLMKGALRVFANDSAPLHLASSVNAKTTAIFCSTVSEFGYGPLAEDAKIIQLDPRLECMPCGLHGKKECPLSHFNCSNEINAKKVFETIKSFS